VGTAAVTALIMAITFLILYFSGRIISVIGMNGASILTKLMGMILAALSVQLVMNALGIEQWLGAAQ
jgi:multiple antibiotic resistance protein